MMTSTKNNSKAELDKKIQVILDLKNSGDLSNAIENAKKLTEEFSKTASTFGLLASLYFEIESFEEASSNFKKATVISPKSETASLGLFHSLWRLGDQDNALVEMQRFTSICNSEEYNNLIKEMVTDHRGA